MKVASRLSALGQWVAAGSAVGVLCGGASALFLYLLEQVTTLRGQHEALIYLLPVAGLVVGWLYQRYGQPIRGGNNLIIDTIHDDGPELPLRMAPMVLLGTCLLYTSRCV